MGSKMVATTIEVTPLRIPSKVEIMI